MTLPIPISTPIDRTLWQNIERTLQDIAIKEQSLNRRDRLVTNSLALAKNYAKNNEWSKLFSYLTERKIVAVNEPKTVVAKPKKLRRTRIRTKHYAKSFKQKVLALLPQVLFSDRALSVATITAKLANHLEIQERLCRDYLAEFAKQGLVHKSHLSTNKFVLYSLEPTDEIDNGEWIPSAVAFEIAKRNGCSLGHSFFRNYFATQSQDKVVKFYRQWGLEYRDYNNLRWRIIA